MGASAEDGGRPLETGWLDDTPVGDTLLRRFAFNQSELNECFADAAGGRSDRAREVSLADSGGPIAFFNQAIPLRPLAGLDDPVLDVAEQFYAGASHASTLLSLWPTPDLSTRGWALGGHPAFVARPPGPHAPARPEVDVRLVENGADLEAVERVAIDGYPLDEARPLPPGALLPPALLETPIRYRLALLDGEPVAAASNHAGHGVVNLCFAATLPQARRHGAWSALLWARVDEHPDLPAVAFTSDFSRPGFERLGFLVLTRFTLWWRSPAAG
jgi:hypothetical protein